ncbi:MAG TPA: NADH-quinone oxidoreductase subunit C [Devosia sp.]|jgi:Ni,Fe-hydrogenase III large subunit|uniref:hydrogenase large subunit n=1 Tax=Devosia sp. TaxID=1871048 RepID=UPI002DDD39D0|nr:NADH-quinone oxidoreductase subunit C [Devosia sp.]HEV2515410.1 NADH-quinone oxidoreductase subunit C [Devosia sp.]
MSALADLVAKGTPVPQHGPWPRCLVDRDVWGEALGALGVGQLTLLGLWGETASVHIAILDPASSTVGVLSLPCPDGVYPSVGRVHPPAMRLDRAIHDLFGLVPEGLPDPRPWLDHGTWPSAFPLSPARAVTGDPQPYTFLPVEGESLHQIAVGPVHAGIIEPGHFRFTANGEAVVRLEERLGYTHKGIESLMAGATLEAAAKLAGRVSGDSTVAYAWAFAMAVESAMQLEVPSRAIWLRALMAELERLANHLGDIGAICNDAAFALLHAHFGALRERTLRAADVAFGHRLMRDRIVPGGVATELNLDGIAAISSLIAEVRAQLPRLVETYDNTASLQDRTVSTGVLKATLAAQYGAGGYVGRASGRSFDTRRTLPYAPYDELTFEVPMLTEGDVDARVWIRIREVEQSLSLAEQILAAMPQGPIVAALNRSAGLCEGMVLVEGFRGDVLVWLRLGPDGSIERCHLRDPSWFQWPLLEAIVENNIVADFPLCNKSFNCSYSGHDL